MLRKIGLHHRAFSSGPGPVPVAPPNGDSLFINPSEPKLEPKPNLEFSRDSSTASQHDDLRRTISVPNATISELSNQNPQLGEMQTKDSLGLHLVRNVLDPCGDIIFVHGLGGMARKTWCYDRNLDYFWPPWLGEEDGLSSFRIFTFGYNSDFKGACTNLNIFDFAKDLLFQILTFSDGSGADQAPLGHRTIFFVAHSMGGLVVKKAYVLGKQDHEYVDIMSRVHGILFLATPHRGAEYAKTLNNILSTAPFGSSKAYIADLNIHSSALQDINEQFRVLCGDLALVSFYETLKTSFGIAKVLVVGKESGVLGYPQEISSSLNADHHTVCKFKTRQDPNYISVRNILKLWATRIQALRPIAHIHSTSLDAHTVMNINSMLSIQESVVNELDTIRKNITQGTGLWLTQRQDFIDWIGSYQDSSKSKMYYLTGLPATGKSSLAAVVIDHVKSVQEHCHYYFFSSNHQAKRTAAYCLRSIASQLAQKSEEFRQSLFKLNQESDLAFISESQSFNMIWEKIFEGIVFKMRFPGPLYWALDAIDEADSPIMLIGHLMKIQSLTPIKFFLTSRPMKMPLTFIEKSSICVLTETETLRDIQAYIHSVVRDALPNDAQIQEDIVRQVLMKASGSFLWVKLALKTLQDSWHTQDDIRKALTEVPKGMEQLYETMLKTVQTQPSRLQLITKRILMWASCCWRPLSIAELEVALQPEFQGFVKLQDTIMQICGHFISVENSRLTLIHLTARQFLCSDRNGVPAFIQNRYGHEHIAITCLQYLSTDNWRRTFKSIEKGTPKENRDSRVDRILLNEKDHPFLSYAIRYWAYHVSKSSVDSQDLLESLRSFFARYSLIWIEAIALSGNLRYLVRSAQHLKAFSKRMLRKANNNAASNLLSLEEPPENEARLIQMWANDFIRIVRKFGINLVQSPSSIHRLVAPFCPLDSRIRSQYNNAKDRALSVAGLHSNKWDDCLAGVSIGQDQSASKVLATDTYFITLISSGGIIIVWHAETCEEARRMHHKEYTPLMSLNKSKTRLVTAGLHTYRVWDISSGRELYCLPKVAQARTMALKFNKSDSELVIGLDDCTITCYDLETADVSFCFLARSREVEALGCPRIMALNPDLSKVAMAWRGKPPMVWDMTAGQAQEPEQCKIYHENDALCAPQKIEWQTDGNSVLILCQDTTLVEWRLYDEDQIKFEHIKACQMTISGDGNFLLTSDSMGTMSVWIFPRLCLIYRLISENEFIWDLTFSPDAQRFYDIRQSTCNVWEPDALVRPDELELEDQSSVDDVSIMTEPVISHEESSQSLVTSLATDSKDQYYCCGREDGTVIIHDAVEGKQVRKVYSHGRGSSVLILAWSISGRYIVSGDDASRVVAKRLEVKEAGKWGVFPVFDFRVTEAVQQLLFSVDEKKVLISTSSTDLIWGLKEKRELCRRQWVSRQGRRWVEHPLNPELLIWIDAAGFFHTYNWATLRHSDISLPSPVECISPAQGLCSVQASMRAQSHGRLVHWIAVTSDKRYLVYETLPASSRIRSVPPEGLHLEFLSISDLAVYHPHLLESECMADLAGQVRRLIGTFEDTIVFLDQSYWLSTWKIDTSINEVKRHFFLPRDWLNVNTLQMATLNSHGTFFFPRNGDVAIVRGGMNL